MRFTAAACMVLFLTACTIVPGNGGVGSASSSSIASSSASSIALVMINVVNPFPGDVIESPLMVAGEARGNWYFEADFPVRLYDGNGMEIGLGIAQAQGDWMTTDFVPFIATVTFTPPTTSTGTLVLEKDNPSGLPEFADSFVIPVLF